MCPRVPVAVHPRGPRRRPSGSSERSRIRFSEETSQELSDVEGQHHGAPAHVDILVNEIARVAFVRPYPRRSLLGLALLVGQAFIYNAITFDLGTVLLSTFYGVAAATGAGLIVVIWALSKPSARIRTRPGVRHRRPQADGRRLLPRLGGGSRGSASCLPPASGGRLGSACSLRSWWVVFFLASCRRELGVPDRERDLPDGDSGAGNRVLRTSVRR